MVSPALSALYVDGHVSVIVLGRLAVLRMREALPLNIVNVHLFPIGPYSVAAQLRRLSEHMSSLREAVTVVRGHQHVFSRRRATRHNGRTFVGRHLSVRDLPGGALKDFHEIVAQACSRAQHRRGRPKVLSRIDKVFTNTPAQSLMGGRCFAQYCAGVLDRTLPSDHAPQEVRFLPPRCGGRPKIPQWALRHPVYGERRLLGMPASHLSRLFGSSLMLLGLRWPRYAAAGSTSVRVPLLGRPIGQLRLALFGDEATLTDSRACALQE